MIRLRDLPELAAKEMPRAFLYWLADVLNRMNNKLDLLTGGTVGNFTDIIDGGEVADSGKAKPGGVVVGTTDTQTLSNKTLWKPAIADFSEAQHDHEDADDAGQLREEALNLRDATVNDASNAKHGFLPKLSDVETEYLTGKGTWKPPAFKGTFTMAAAANFTVNDANVTADCVILLEAQNAAASALRRTLGICEIPANRVVGVSFRVDTDTGGAAAGNEVFGYAIVK